MSACGAAITYSFCFSSSCIITTLFDWQTLIAGGLAVFAAWRAVVAARAQLKTFEDQLSVSKDQLDTARRQLDDQRNQADRDRAGRLRAARASLPTALTTICAYAEEAAQSLKQQFPKFSNFYENMTPETDFQVQVVVPKFPPEVLPVLERLVELSDDNDISKMIESILREVQVFTARTGKLRIVSSVSTIQLSEAILQAVVIYARAETLYSYARRQSDVVDPKPLWDRVFGVLFLMDLDKDERIIGTARRQRDDGMQPGEADTLPPE